MVITKYYSAADADDWSDGAEFDRAADAREHAQKHGNVVVAAEFEFSDSEMIEDYRKVDESSVTDPCECCDEDPCVHANELPDGAGEP